LFIWAGRHVSRLVVNVIWANFDSSTFIVHFRNYFSIASRLVHRLCEGISGSLSMANSALLSANVAIADSKDLFQKLHTVNLQNPATKVGFNVVSQFIKVRL
jgi:hypothetical protein